MNVDKILSNLGDLWTPELGANIAGAAVAVILAIIVLRFIRKRRPQDQLKKIKAPRADRWLTFLGAAMASSMAAYTMWLAIDESMPSWLKSGTVTFLEINLVAAALRSRHFRLLHAQRVEELLEKDPNAIPPARERDVDGIAVWVMAAGSALLGFVESKTAVETIVRVLAPPIAAFSWERALVGELRQFVTRKISPVVWANPLHTLAVRLGLATPTEQHQSVNAADRARRIALVVDAGFRAGIASRLPLKLNQLADAFANARYYRRLRAIQRRYGSSAELLGEIRLGVAALRQGRAAVDDANLSQLDPWGDPAADRKAHQAAAAELEQLRITAERAGQQHEEQINALRAELDQVRGGSLAALTEANEKLTAARAEVERAAQATDAAEQRAADARANAGGRDHLVEKMLKQAQEEIRAVRQQAQAAAEQHRQDTDTLRAQLSALQNRPAPRLPRPPSFGNPISPAPAGAGGPRDPYVTYADAITQVQAGVPDWKTRDKAITQGEIQRFAGITGVPTQQRIKYLIEAMADRNPQAAGQWLVVEKGVLTEDQLPAGARQTSDVTSD